MDAVTACRSIPTAFPYQRLHPGASTILQKGTNVEPALGQTAGNTGLTSGISLNYTQMRLHKTKCSILVGYVLSFISTV